MSLQLYKNIRKDIDTQKYLFLSTGYASNVSSSQLQYLNNGFDIYVVLHENSQMAQQVEFNPEVKLVFDSASSAKSKGIEYRGVMEKVTDKKTNFEYAKKFTRRFRRFKSYFFSRKTTVYRIKPVEIRRIQFDNRTDESILEFKENDRGYFSKMLFKFGKICKSWKEATRVHLITTSLGSVLLGNAMAWSIRGMFDWTLFGLTVLGTILIHLGANMMNDFHDHLTGNDTFNLFHNEITGGSRIIQKGVFSPEKVLLSSIILLLSGVGLGLYINYLVPGNGLLIFGLIGLVLTIGYSIPGLKLIYRGLGEITLSLAFGMVITVGSYFVQTGGTLEAAPFIAAVPLTFFVLLTLFINEFQDYRADKNADKKTLVVRIGDKWKAMRLFSFLIFLPYVWIVPFVIVGLMPWWSLLMLLTLPLAIIAIRKGSIKYRKIYELLIVNKLTITIHFLTAVLLSLAYILDKIV